MLFLPYLLYKHLKSLHFNALLVLYSLPNLFTPLSFYHREPPNSLHAIGLVCLSFLASLCLRYTKAVLDGLHSLILLFYRGLTHTFLVVTIYIDFVISTFFQVENPLIAFQFFYNYLHASIQFSLLLLVKCHVSLVFLHSLALPFLH